MPFDADGVFTRVTNSFSNPTSGTVIDPGEADALFDDYDSALSDIGEFTQPASYPVEVTYGHRIPYLDSDVQFGNAWSQYPLGSVSTNPILIGKAGCSIGSTTLGQTFKIVFTSSGLAGSPITITYTAGAAETTTTIAAGLAALVNANTTLHGTGGKPIFMQSLGGGVFNLQYNSAFGATGATPLTTATTGSTGTINLTAEANALDFIIMQLGRNAPGHTGKVGDGIYALDFTGQDSTGTFNTHYGQITVAVADPTAGATRGLMVFTTASNAGLYGRLAIKEGAYLYDSTGTAPTGGDIGAGTLNLPSTGGYYVAGNAFAVSGALYALGGNLFGGALNGSTLNLQSTQSGTPSADFVQIKAGGKVGYKFDGVDSTFGTSGTLLGVAKFANLTSGSISIQPPTGALGTRVLTLPVATDTLVGKATTDILTNKTFDSAGTGNVLQVSGVTVSRGQFPGESTTGSATAGNIGEIVVSEVLVGSAVSLSNGTPANITSISLTAGDWDVCGNVCFDPNAATTWTSAQAWTSTTSAAAPTAPNKGAYAQIGAPMTTGADQFLTVGTQRISVSGTTTVYLSALAGFAVNTMVGYGYLRARRVR
jgi:hypothetical protein